MIRQAFLTVKDNYEECRHLDIPTLIIVGEEDEDWHYEAERLHEVIQGSEFYSIQGAGHVVHLQKPDLVGELIEDFLRRNRAGAELGRHAQ